MPCNNCLLSRRSRVRVAAESQTKISLAVNELHFDSELFYSIISTIQASKILYLSRKTSKTYRKTSVLFHLCFTDKSEFLKSNKATL